MSISHNLEQHTVSEGACNADKRSRLDSVVLAHGLDQQRDRTLLANLCENKVSEQTSHRAANLRSDVLVDEETAERLTASCQDDCIVGVRAHGLNDGVERASLEQREDGLLVDGQLRQHLERVEQRIAILHVREDALRHESA